MRIPKSVSAFKKWARTARGGSDRIITIGACVAYNESKRKDGAGIMSVLGIVAEECAIRWEKASQRA